MYTPILNNSIILDCRPLEQFLQSRAKDSAHICSSELFQRMHELPRTDESFIVICTLETIKNCQTFFTDKHYSNISYIIWNQVVVNTLESIRRIDNNKLNEITQPYALWQPASFIKDFVNQYSKKFNIEPSTGLDIACGSGRDLVYLAKHGWDMIGMDYNEGSLTRCQDLAKRYQVDVRCQHIDLEKDELNFETHIPANTLGLISVFRYLHRPLLHTIRNSLKPGGVVLYQTFMQGCELISRPKNPRFLLADQELAEVFSPEHGFEILINEVHYLHDKRPVSYFLARKLT